MISGHGGPGGVDLGKQYFSDDVLSTHPAAVQKIKKALQPNALIDFQSCLAASGKKGAEGLRTIADLLNARVRGSTGDVNGWDVTNGKWIIFHPRKR